MLHQGERVVPASENRGGTQGGDTINIVNNWAPGTDRRTIDYAVGEMERRIGLRRRGMSV